MCEPQDFIVVIKAVAHYHGKIVLVKRNKNCAYFPDMWELPGGKITDEDFKCRSVSRCNILINALKREIGEETNSIVAVNELPITHYIAKPEKSGKYIGKAALIMFFQGVTDCFKPICGEDVEKIGLFDFIDIIQMNDNNEIPASHFDAIKKSKTY